MSKVPPFWAPFPALSTGGSKMTSRILHAWIPEEQAVALAGHQAYGTLTGFRTYVFSISLLL